jgi:hypothetical protein
MASKWRLSSVCAVFTLVAACALPSQSAAPQPPSGAPSAIAASNETLPPVAGDSVRFAVLGDSGTGQRPQYQVGAQLALSRDTFPFEFVIMLGDNMYGSERPADFIRKFELPYKPLHDANIPFYAALGNHDDPNQRFYRPFNMGGERYYSFRKDGVHFFALDSNYMTREQLAWLDGELRRSNARWKIAFFHHPLYSSGGRHGSELDLRQQLEPLFVKHGVNAAFAGHEHFYERVKPQNGIYYFTAGGSAKLRSGNIRATGLTEVGYDRDRTYMLVEVTDEALHIQALTRTGRRVDHSVLPRLQGVTTQP